MQFSWNNGEKKTSWIYWADNINDSDIKAALSDCDYLQVWYPRHVEKEIGQRYREILTIVEGNEYQFGDKVYSKSINLEMTEEQILSGFSKTRRYEVRRAANRDEVEVSFKFPDSRDQDLDEYIAFYNAFAEQRCLSPVCEDKIDKICALINSHMFALGKVCDRSGKTLVIHGYLVCEEMKIVALYSSSSVEYNQYISRANGYLHYSAMCMFKKKGFKKYDLGGFYQGSDKQKMNVSEFKDSLGGEIEEFATGFLIQAKELRNVEKNLVICKEDILKKKVIIYGMASWGKYIVRRIKEIYDVFPECLIDNNLSEKDKGYLNENVLEKYIPEKTLIIITTTYENYKSICAGKYVKPFFDRGNTYCIRELTTKKSGERGDGKNKIVEGI